VPRLEIVESPKIIDTRQQLAQRRRKRWMKRGVKNGIG
jgi:hypothetical protein